MFPIDALVTIVDVAFKIQEVAHNVKANKAQCLVLSERVQIIVDLGKRLRAGAKDLTTFNASMELSERCLYDCLTFMMGFTTDKWYRNIMSNGSHKEKFQELNENLQRCISSFNLGMTIDLNIKFDKQLDIAAEAKDREQFATKDMQECILEEHQKEQKQLAEIYAMQQKLQENATKQAESEQKITALVQQQLISIKQHLEQLAAVPSVSGAVASGLPIDKSLIVNFSDLDIMGFIGEGNSAAVYAGKLYDADIAIKKLKKPTPELIKELYREANILARLKGDGIVRCYGVCTTEGEECLITELMHGGALKTHLLDLTKPLNADTQKQWALEIARGIGTLHKQGVIHRDLKSANILLSKDGHAKIADFDLSVMDTASLGTVAYTSQTFECMAPELKKLNGKASVQSDIYSYGSILWELMTRTVAPLDKKEAKLTNLPDAYAVIVAKCWNDAPDLRPKIEEIIAIIESYKSLDCRVLYQKGAEYEKTSRFKEAFDCYLKSAELGYGRSEFRVGMFLLQGKIGKQNKSEAFAYLIKAASHENHDQPKACFNVAAMLEAGDGVVQNLLQAEYWYGEAIKLGNMDATKKLQELKQKSKSIYQDNLSSVGLVSMAQAQSKSLSSVAIQPTGSLYPNFSASILSPSAPPMSGVNQLSNVLEDEGGKFKTDENYYDNSVSSIGLVSQVSKLKFK